MTRASGDRSWPPATRSHHLLDGFDCGDDELNTWLIKRARNNEGKFARSFVLCDDKQHVTGYYCLAAGAVERSILGKKLQRNAPEVIPATILGRLAVDLSCQNQGIGGLLLHDALQKALYASRSVGSRLVLLHEKNDRVLDFYTRSGFLPLPEYSLTMVLPMESIVDSLESG